MKDAQTLGMDDIPGSTSRVIRPSNDRDTRPSLLAALSEWEAIAYEARVSKAALAYRWLTYNSRLSAEHGDGMIIGATRGSQLEEHLRAIEDGPLDENIAKKIDKVWELVKDEAPIDCSH